MVLVKEFRVVLPCSVQEYQVGQLYSVAEASKNETGGGEGIQVLKNEPYEKDGETGQYTHKIYHLKSKVPGFVRMIAPEGSLVFHEKAWNAYPYCRTIVTNEYMKEDFFIKIETWHKPDLGSSDNVHELDPDTWKSVEVIHIDIADQSQVEPGDYKADEDPALFQSVKTKRGPLGPNWKKELAAEEDCSKMCAYKLVTIKFKWWGLQNKVENFIQKQEKRIFTNFHRQLFCWIDKWIDLSMEDIRRMEDETQRELEAVSVCPHPAYREWAAFEDWQEFVSPEAPMPAGAPCELSLFQEQLGWGREGPAGCFQGWQALDQGCPSTAVGRCWLWSAWQGIRLWGKALARRAEPQQTNNPLLLAGALSSSSLAGCLATAVSSCRGSAVGLILAAFLNPPSTLEHLQFPVFLSLLLLAHKSDFRSWSGELGPEWGSARQHNLQGCGAAVLPGVLTAFSSSGLHTPALQCSMPFLACLG